MALKDINIFEQHVEKIVLAVAAAGALFMGYLAMNPVALPDHPDVGPKDVEEKIAAKIKELEDTQKALNPNPEPKGKDWVKSYNDIAAGEPLGQVVLTRAPEMGPRNLQPNFKGEVVQEDFKAVVPDPAMPEMVHGEALQPLVTMAIGPVDPQTGALAAPPAGQLYQTTAHNVVVIDGYIPVGKMVLQMAKQKDKARFVPAQLQRGLVYRIRVLRSELLANGTWSKPEQVTPAKGSPSPTEILTTAMPDGGLFDLLPAIDAQFQQIQLPTYYWDANGQPLQPPILSRPIPQAIQDETLKLHSDITTAQAAQGGGFVANPGGVGGIPGMPVVGPGAVGPGGVPAAGPLFPPTAPEISPLEVQPFTFWDDSVQPDHKYKYSLQVQLVNPGFGWRFGLADKSFKIEPVIPTGNNGIVDVPGTIVVHSDMAFFISGLDFAGKITGELLKQENGRWYRGSFTVDRGMNVAGQISMGPGNTKDIDTKFALVDFQDGGRSGNVHVILKDPTGNLVSRDTKEDWNTPEQKDLQKKVADGNTAATATATAPVGGTVTPTPVATPTPVTPTPRGPTPTPPTPVTPPATRRGPVTGPPVRGGV